MRQDILEKKLEILNWIKNGLSKQEMSRRLSTDIKTLNRYLLKLGIEYHGKQAWNEGSFYARKTYMSFNEYVNRENVNINTNKIRKKLLRDGFKKHICEQCGNTEWMNQPIPLEVHHIDGNKNNNELSNLQLLCPNCHALTPTYRGKNIKK